MNIKTLKDFYNSSEGIKFLSDIQKEEELKEELCKKYMEKFHSLTKEEKNLFIEKLIAKYESDEYINRWYKQGIEPPCDLYFLLHDYYIEYGLEDYTVELICGQGCIVRISKVIQKELHIWLGDEISYDRHVLTYYQTKEAIAKKRGIIDTYCLSFLSTTYIYDYNYAIYVHTSIKDNEVLYFNKGIFPNTEKEIRPAHNIEKMFKAGMFLK